LEEFSFLYPLVEQGLSLVVDTLLALAFMIKLLEEEKEPSPKLEKEVLIATL
jgi:hypothetical protein